MKEAMSGPHADDWHTVYNKEISCLEGAHTWELVDPPPSVLILPCVGTFSRPSRP
jgi:hypothetical protein